MFLQLRVWPRPLYLLLGPPAAALGLDARGSELGALSGEDQVGWSRSGSGTCICDTS